MKRKRSTGKPAAGKPAKTFRLGDKLGRSQRSSSGRRKRKRSGFLKGW